MKTVEVFLEGGVVHTVHVPDNVAVVIYDYDVEGEDEARIQHDSNGTECTITKWHGDCDDTAELDTVRIVDGKPCCPQCGNGGLLHSFDMTCCGQLEVRNGELFAVNHRHNSPFSEYNQRISCTDCGWLCTSLAPDIV